MQIAVFELHQTMKFFSMDETLKSFRVSQKLLRHFIDILFTFYMLEIEELFYTDSCPSLQKTVDDMIPMGPRISLIPRKLTKSGPSTLNQSVQKGFLALLKQCISGSTSTTVLVAEIDSITHFRMLNQNNIARCFSDI